MTGSEPDCTARNIAAEARANTIHGQTAAATLPCVMENDCFVTTRRRSQSRLDHAAIHGEFDVSVRETRFVSITATKATLAISSLKNLQFQHFCLSYMLNIKIRGRNDRRADSGGRKRRRNDSDAG
jgi:hypothetical protein